MALGKLDAIKARQIELGERPVFDAPVQAVANDAPKNKAHYLAALEADLASLSALKTLAAKIEAKKHMVEVFWPYADAYVKRGDHYPDEIVVRVMIWLLDIEDMERGLPLALHLIKQGGHRLPPKFDRDIETFVCDAVYDWANVLLKTEQSASPHLDALVDRLESDKWSLSPPVHSKMLAMLAKHKQRYGDHALVVQLCDRAMAVNPEGAGVKTIRLASKAELRKQAEKAAKVSNFDPDEEQVSGEQ